MKHLKTFFTFMLMAVLSVGQVWGAAATVYTSNVTLSSGTKDGSTASVKATNSKAAISSTNYDAVKLGSSGNAGNFYIEVPANTTTITLHAAGWNGKSNKLTLSTTATGVSISPSDAQALTANSGVSGSSTTYTITPNNDKEFFTFTLTGVSAASIIKIACTERCLVWGVNAEAGGSTPTPTVTADPDEVANVAYAGVTDQTIDLTYDNISDYETEVSIHSNADGTGTLSPAWLTASVSDADDYATITYSVSANTGAARTAYIKVYATDGDKEATTIIPVSQVKYSAPTGTFELFSGDLVEGEYVICSGANAMKNVVTSAPRIDVATVTVSDNKIQNPDESLIWNIEALTGDDAGKWTIYNEAEEVYAAFNTTDGRGVLLEEITDYAKWTTSGTYDFINVGKTSKNYLRYNSGYGFASYANATGATLTLYKKSDGKPAAPTFSPAGGSYLEAQSVTISAIDGASIYYTTDGSTTPTTSSTPYTGAIAVNTTTTIKAIAVKNAVSSNVTTVTYTITTPLSVDAAIALIPNANDQVDNQYVEGYVCTAGTSVLDDGKMTYYISADGSETNRLQIYKGKNLNNTEFSNVNDLAIGDKVVVFGQLKNYEGTLEMNNGNYIARHTAKGALQSVAVSGTPTRTEYAANEDFDPTGLTVLGTYASGFVSEITEGITWGNDLNDGKVTESTTVHVTATVSGKTSSAHDVAVIVATKTLVSIAVGTVSYTIYTGEALPKPIVTATYSEDEPDDVSELAVYDSESVFNTATIDNPNPQTITVSYTFGGETKTTTYTVSVKDYANDAAHPYTVTEALYIITNAIGSTASARNIYVQGIVSQKSNPSSNTQTYYISENGAKTNELEIYKGKYISGANFTNSNQVLVGDEVVVGGKVKLFNSTPEFDSGSELQSLARTPNFEIADVASFEVGTADLAVTDLTVAKDGEGAVTLASSDKTNHVSIADGKLHAVAAGTATITANLAANGIYKAATTTFDVEVIAATVKYAISFDGNGADGGSAPEAIADKAAGDNVTLPANSYTKTNKVFDGWKVINNTTTEEVTVTAGAFTMPASAVTIQAQWTDVPYWSTIYDNNVTVTHTGSGATGTITIGTDDPYALEKAGASSNTGTIVVTVPYGTTDLHFHAFAWGGKTAKIQISGVTNPSVSEFDLAGEAGASGSGNDFTLQGNPVDQYFHVSFDAVEAETQITFSKATGSADNRFFFYGVNQEGGVLPVLDHIAISGTMTNTTGWKTGDEITPEGLTVNAIYTLNSVEQDPVDVTSSVVWSHAALVENQTEVTLTATYTESEVVKSANANVTIAAVETGAPTIITDPESYLNFGASIEKDAVVASKTITVTLKNITNATATLGGTNYSAFSIDDTEIVDGDVITVSVNTSTLGVYAGTISIKDNNSETEKVITLSMTVVAPDVPETAVSTTSKWIAATDADLVDGKDVLITGVDKDGVTYAIGVQNDNNRAVVVASVDGEDVLTPGENTMSFTLVAQEDGTFALRTSNDKYLYAASSSKNYLKSQADIDDNAKWTLTATSAEANGTNTHNLLKFNATNNPKIFSCYASGQTDIQFYVPKPAPKYSVTYAAGEGSGDVPDAVEYVQGATFTVAAANLFTAPDGKEFDKWNDGTDDYAPGATYTVGTSDVVLTAQWKDAAVTPDPEPTPDYGSYQRPTTAGNYGTICLPKAGTITGAALYDIADYIDGTLYCDQVEGNAMEAGKPYLFFAMGEQLNVTYTSDEVAEEAGSANGLYGFYDLEDEDAHLNLDADDGNYILYSNQYWLVSGRDAYISNYRAYLKIAQINYVAPAPGRRRVAMSVNGEQVATGIENINASENPVKLIINDHIYILRGEKMYDATGRLVK